MPASLSALRYLLTRLLLIGVTIFLGVFATVLLADQPPPPGVGGSVPQLQADIETQIERYVRAYLYGKSLSVQSDAGAEAAAQIRADLRSKSGLNLPYWQRHLFWTWKLLQFDWGWLAYTAEGDNFFQRTVNSSALILEAFPNTLLLVASANLLVFVLGLPFSLYLARHYGNWVDAFTAFFAPLSSVPSWVLGVLLISLFAVELRWLPLGGMYDTLPPENFAGYLPVVLRHMVLPVTAIVLSLLFQLVYSWRTLFLLYAQEDYVELARAKGLMENQLQQKYILRPTLPYVLTSFSLSLVSFWQMAMALEVVFHWPGLGFLYINQALPNYWGESMYPGELLIAVGIVVIFAYLLGAVVLILDIVYAWVDPRIHLLRPQAAERPKPALSLPGWRLNPGGWGWKSVSFSGLWDALQDLVRSLRRGLAGFLRQVWRYPSAVFSFALILLLLFGSFYALVAYPYEQVGRVWGAERLVGRAYVPRLAAPAWVNAFRLSPLLSVLRLSEPERTEQTLENGWRQVTLTYTFSYPYGDFPQEIFLYLNAEFVEKQPFVSLRWLTPDGRDLNLKALKAGRDVPYDFEAAIPLRRWVAENPLWQAWFNFGQVQTTPAFYTLFADPQSDSPRPLQGEYRLLLTTLLFEEESEISAELVLLGQVYGLAGTDYLRRDLLVPLLWGMPFALVFGLSGALVTTLLSLLLAAMGVWFGGWVDSLIQRLTEANMILPVLAIGVLAYSLLGIDLWVILGVIILLNVFGSPTKNFRAALLQVKEASYIEAAYAYGASSARMITHYLIPRMAALVVPQLVALIPGFVFLEATLGLFNIKSDYPTWGRVIYLGLKNGALYGSRYWVLEPIFLLLLTGLAFSLLGAALERILNPRLLEK